MATTAELLARAEQYQVRGQLRPAEELYRQVLASEPQNVHALARLAVVCHMQGRVEESIPLYLQAIEVYPTFADMHNNLGVAYSAQGRLKEALDCYRKAVFLNPDYVDAHNNVGLMLAAQGEYDAAIVSYQRALKLRPRYPEALSNLGIAHFQQQHVEEAVRCFRAALALKPDYPEAFNNLGNAQLQQGQLNEAADSYRHALRLRPDNAEAENNLGVVLHSLGQEQEALACWERSLASNPNDPRTHRNLANYYAGQRQDAEALRCFERVVALSPEDAEARFQVSVRRQTSMPTTAPAEFVRSVFDSYAENFDQDLVQRLRYRGPEMLKAALEPAPPPRSLTVLDLGCGTGLCGVQFRDWASTLIGVDLAPKMLAKARERKIYDELILGDLLVPLQNAERKYDLIVAADVLIYLGDVQELFPAVHRALRPEGRFAFTVELLEETDFRLLPTTVRFAHSLAYRRSKAAEHHLREVRVDHAVLRKENETDVPGVAMVLARA